MTKCHRLLRGALLCGVFSVVCLSWAEAYQGFGTGTTGGNGKPVYTVKSLAASGSGTLADAVSRSNRHIKFAVAGTIKLSSPIRVKGSYLTIDGSSAPAPGITLSGAGLYIYGNAGAHDVIVRNIRVRNAADDSFGVAYGGYNVVFDHVSAQGAVDGNIDITADSHDVTVAWSIFANPVLEKNSLMAYHAQRITMHHNLFVDSTDRNPNIAHDYSGAAATNVTLDFSNNLVWDWRGGIGLRVHYGAKANVVNNYLYAPGGDNEDGLVVCRATGVPAAHSGDCNNGDQTRFARAYVAGNVNPGATNWNINTVGTESRPFGAAPVTLENACTAAARVRNEAGAWPRDAIDKTYVSLVSVRSDLCSTYSTSSTTSVRSISSASSGAAVSEPSPRPSSRTGKEVYNYGSDVD